LRCRGAEGAEEESKEYCGSMEKVARPLKVEEERSVVENGKSVVLRSFAVLGPLSEVSFVATRFWQLAVDGVPTTSCGLAASVEADGEEKSVMPGETSSASLEMPSR
jgi:hypothetical protein